MRFSLSLDRSTVCLLLIGPKWCAEDYAREKMERLCASAVDLQAALEREPMKAGYNMHVETLAIAAKTATNLARQVSVFLLFP